MKKKLLLLLTILPLMLTGCGNHDISWGSYSFHYVHVQMYGTVVPVHLKVTSWKSDEGGIELKTENFGTILLGDGTYMMYDTDNCPLCGKVSYR